MNPTILCPYCGAENAVVADVENGSQTFTTDCENCCRPFEVHVEIDGGQVVAAWTN